MKKNLALALTLVFVVVASLSIVEVQAQQVRNVGPGQTFPTISAALVGAPPGTVIHVWGSITDSPVIAIPNIRIVGQSLSVMITPAAPGSCFTVTATGVTIMQLTIRGTFRVPGDIGIDIIPPAAQCKIYYNNIFSFDYGISIRNSTNNQIVGNDVSDCTVRLGPPPGFSSAIYIAGWFSTNNVIQGNELGLSAPNNLGVEIVNFAGGNTITFNNFWGGPHNVPQAFVGGPPPNAWTATITTPTGVVFKGNWWNDGWPQPPYVIPVLPDVDTAPMAVAYNWALTPWDLDRNGICNIKDVAMTAVAFGSFWSHPRWNPIADVNQDGAVNIKDIAFVARMFGWTDP